MIFAAFARALAAVGLSDRLSRILAPWAAGVAFFAILALLAWLAVTIADRWHENTIAVATDAGAAHAVIAGQQQTLEQLGDANNAEQDLRSAGERDALRYSHCLLDARDKAACERFKPLAGE